MRSPQNRAVFSEFFCTDSEKAPAKFIEAFYDEVFAAARIGRYFFAELFECFTKIVNLLDTFAGYRNTARERVQTGQKMFGLLAKDGETASTKSVEWEHVKMNRTLFDFANDKTRRRKPIMVP